jgi:hypothetical protein
MKPEKIITKIPITQEDVLIGHVQLEFQNDVTGDDSGDIKIRLKPISSASSIIAMDTGDRHSFTKIYLTDGSGKKIEKLRLCLE